MVCGEQVELDVFCQRARSFFERGMPREAIELYSDVIRVSAEYAPAYAGRGTVYALLRLFDSALQDVIKANQIYPAESDYACTAGTLFIELKNLDKAFEYFEKAISTKPDHLLAFYNRATAYHKIGRIEKAMEDLERCLDINEDDEMAKAIRYRMTVVSPARR